MQHEIEQLRADNLRLRQELEQTQIDLALKNNEFEAVCMMSQATLKNYMDGAEMDRKKAQEFHDELLALRRELYLRKSEYNSICGSYEQAKLAFRTQIENYNHALASQSALDHLEALLAATETTVSHLFPRVTAMERNQSALIRVIGQYEDLAEDALSEASNKADDYKEACDDIELLRFDLAGQLVDPEREAERDTQLRDMEERNAILQARINALEKWNDNLESRVHEREAQLLAQHQYIQNQERFWAFQRREFHGLQVASQWCVRAIADEMHTVRLELAQVANGFHEDAQKIAQLEERIAQFQEQNVLFQDEIARLADSCVRATSSAQDLRRHNAELKKSRFAPDEAREMREKIAQLQEQVKECNQRIQKQDSQIEEAEFQFGVVKLNTEKYVEKIDAAFGRLKLHAAGAAGYIDPEDIKSIRNDFDDLRDQIYDASGFMDDEHQAIRGQVKGMRKNFNLRLEQITQHVNRIKIANFKAEVQTDRITEELTISRIQFEGTMTAYRMREQEITHKLTQTQELLRIAQAEANRYKELAGKEPLTKKDFHKERADLRNRIDALKTELEQCKFYAESEAKRAEQANEARINMIREFSNADLENKMLKDIIARLEQEIAMRDLSNSDSDPDSEPEPAPEPTPAPSKAARKGKKRA